MTVLRWIVVLLVLAGSIPLSVTLVAMGLVSIHHPIWKWIPFLEACVVTGFASVLVAGMTAPRFKTAVKILATTTPMAYWLFEARQYFPTATAREIFIIIVGTSGGGLVAWYVLEHYLGEPDT
jgi:hypothetical protein